MDFDARLQRAIERGEKAKEVRGRVAEAEKLTTEELKALHSTYRLEMTEHVEDTLKKLADHLPGFEYQAVYSEDGWGARLVRDELYLEPGSKAETHYSRLEVLVTPFSPSAIIEVTVKGTVRNREMLNRKHYQRLAEVDLNAFKELIDQRILEFAEVYTASR